MNNPEFKRNLWLSFSSHGLIAMPALLALTLIATVLAADASKKAESLYTVATALFIFVVWLWGMRNANASIVDEIRDKTWDQQRMSALSPWDMTWGKLFGATAFNWYGGLMCLAVIAGSGITAGLPDVPATLITLCATGILLHAGVIAINLHACQFESQFVQRGGMGWLGIIFALILWSTFAASSGNDQIVWWGVKADRALFLLDSSLLFAACATFAAWRVVSNALQVRTRPWAWPVFAVLMSVYLGGFTYQGSLIALWGTGLMVALGMSYAALFTETNSLLRWNKLRLLQARQQWRGWLEHLPMWPGTVALSLLFALLLTATSGQPESATTLTPLQGPQALTLALMLVRDTGILLFFWFAQNSKRAVSITLLYLLVLNLLLPFLADVAGIEALRYFLQPFESANDSWTGPLIMSLHALIAFGLVTWRLKQATRATTPVTVKP